MSNTVQTFDRSRIGFISPMYWGGGADGDGRDMTGSAPTPRPSGRTTSWSGQSFEERAHAGNFGDVADDAVDPETPEDVLISLEEELACYPTTRPNGVREAVVHVNGLTLEDFLEGRSGPIVTSPLCLRASARPRRNRRRGGRGRGRSTQRAA